MLPSNAEDFKHASINTKGRDLAYQNTQKVLLNELSAVTYEYDKAAAIM